MTDMAALLVSLVELAPQPCSEPEAEGATVGEFRDPFGQDLAESGANGLQRRPEEEDSSIPGTGHADPS